MPDAEFNPLSPGAGGQKSGIAAKIAAVAAVVAAVGGLADALLASIGKVNTLTCQLRPTLFWCPEPDRSSGTFVQAPPETPATRVNSFVIMAYAVGGGPAAGAATARREWKRVAPDRWVEIYPGGFSSYFEVVGRRGLSDCPGTVLRNTDNKVHRVFIPDKGCNGMPFYISEDGNNWGIASAMSEVQ